MNQEEINKLAIECGADAHGYITQDNISIDMFVLDANELAAYTAAVEALLQARMNSQAEEYDRMREFNDGVVDELQARIAQLEEVLRMIESQAVIIGVNECSRVAKDALPQSPSTWLSEHDNEVRERCAVVCEGMYGALRGECAAAIRELK